MFEYVIVVVEATMVKSCSLLEALVNVEHVVALVVEVVVAVVQEIVQKDVAATIVVRCIHFEYK